jgi:glycosyltransferase involved in cell wall biosynthesis
MRIAINLLAVRSYGTIVYTNGFLPALGNIADKEDEFLVFVASEIVNKISTDISENIRLISLNINSSLIKRLYYEQIYMPQYVNNWGADVLFAPFDLATFMTSCPVLLAVRNPSMALLSSNLIDLSIMERIKGNLHRLASYLSCRKAYKVFYPTSYAMNILGDLAGVPIEKRAMVNHGTDYQYWYLRRDATSVLKEYNLNRNKYVLFVSNFYKYKRVSLLIDAFSSLTDNDKNKEYKLVLVGSPPDDAVKQNIISQISELNLLNNVIFLENISRNNLAILYQEASVFVSPSVMETFGQIYVEAMASGAPVVCADTEFARELCGDAVCYFKVDDKYELINALGKILADSKLRAEKVEKGFSRAKMFSWEREARETLSLLNEANRNIKRSPLCL